jgi:hypothetical protein
MSMKKITSLLGFALLALLVTVVSAENVYVPIPMPTATQEGFLYVHVLCGGNVFSHEMYLTNFADNEAQSVYVRPDGTFDKPLTPGKYVLILLDGDKGQREYKYFDIVAGRITRITFIGHAVSSEGPALSTLPTPIPTIPPIHTPVMKCVKNTICTPGYWQLDINLNNVWHPSVCKVIDVCWWT